MIEVKSSAPLASPSPSRSMPQRVLRAVTQAGGFLLSLGALYWCFRTATSDPALRENWPKLLQLPLWLMVTLPLVSALTVVLSGLVFATVISPVRKLSTVDVVSVNGVCTLLGYFPFKLSLLFRVFWHNRKDQIDLLTIGGWFGAVASVILASLAAAIVAALLAAHRPLLFVSVGVISLVVFGGMLLPAAGLAKAVSGWLRAKLSPSLGDKLFKLTTGLDMLRDKRMLLAAMALRGLDLAAQAVRFILASQAAAMAGLLEVPLEPAQAAIAGSLYFLLQVLAPAGVAGVREAGTVAVLSTISGGLRAEQVIAVVLVVSVSELVGNVLVGVPAALRLWWRASKLPVRAADPYFEH